MKLFYKIFTGIAFCVILNGCQNHSSSAAAEQNVPNSDTLSVQQARLYVANYGKHAGFVDSIVPGITPRMIKLPDTRCIWFSVGRLERLVQQIKSEGGDGIRFYLASYDSTYNKKQGPNIPPRMYWGYNTLIMVSTKDSLGKFHQDYYHGSTNKSIGSIIMADPENRGEICPPPTPCDVIGASLIRN